LELKRFFRNRITGQQLKTLVFENCFDVTGHRIPYAALVATALRDTGHDVTVCLPRTLEASQGLIREYFDSSISMRYFDADSSRTGWRKVSQAKFNFLEVVKAELPNYVAIPTADGIAVSFAEYPFTLGASVLAKTRIDICLMRAPVRKWIKWQAIKMGPWQRILMIDPRVWQESFRDGNRRFELCPDPVPQLVSLNRPDARKALGLPLEKKIIASVGPQTRRKGTDQLVHAFLHSRPENALLLLVGKISPEIQQVLDALSIQDKGKLVGGDRFVSDDDVQSAILASDVVAVPYRDVGRPSGIVSRCICWQRPIIATGRGWLKWAVETYGAGYTAQPEDPVRFGSVIDQALNRAERFPFSKKSREFADFNTEDSYKKTWQRGPTFDRF